MKKTTALITLLFLICTVMSADPWYAAEYARVQEAWSVYGAIASIGVLVSFLIVAVAYMIAIGFDLPELKSWAKAEFYQALASAVLVGGFLSLTWIMLDEGMAKIIGQNIDPFKMAYSYFSNLTSQLTTLYDINYYICAPLEALASITVYSNVGAELPLFSYILKPLVIEPLHLANYYIVQFLVLIGMWRGVLQFFQTSAFATFLPLGVVLRIFPITRGAGGLLIAIAIGFFIVFPTMFAFITMMTEEENSLAEQLQSDKKEPGIGLNLAEFNACDQDLESISKDVEEQTDPAVLAKINSYFSFLPTIWMKILFYPIVVMAVTITFIKTLSPLLGADISEIGQGLIRLI